MIVQGVQLDLIRMISFLERDSDMREVRDTLIAEWLGLKVEVVHKLLEGMALRGYLHLKQNGGEGYNTWLSPRGQALCYPRANRDTHY